MKNYCMSSYLAFRTIFEEDMTFLSNRKNHLFPPTVPKYFVENAHDIGDILQQKINDLYSEGKTAIFLSGGMDSANIASYLPKGTKAYTFECIAENSINETAQAKKYADKYQLDHEVIPMTWDDYLELTPKLMEHAGMPVHSIEIMLYKACLYAKQQGIEQVFIGNSSDPIFGGFDGLLKNEWFFDDFVQRYMFLDPQKALKNFSSVNHIFEPYRINDIYIDYLGFIQNVYAQESETSYMHAFDLSGIKMYDLYIDMTMSQPLDLNRIRNGESKYLIRELFTQRFPDIPVPDKIPMPRATDFWLRNYQVTREEFNQLPNLTGDQKWQLFCLEWFLNIYNL